MSAALFYLKNLAFFPMELLAAVILFALPLQRRPRFFLRLTGALGGLAALLTCYVAVTASVSGVPSEEWYGTPHIGGTLLWCGMLFLLMTGGLWLTHAVPPREAIYTVGCAYLAEHMAYCVRNLLQAAFPGLPIGTGSLLYVLSMLLIYGLIYGLFVTQMVQDRHYAASAVDSFGLTVAVLAVVLVLSAMATQYGFVVIHSVYALLSGVFLLVSQVRQQKRMGLQKELDLQRQLWRQQKAQYEMSKENIEIINRKCHDLKHQVAALKMIQDPEQRARVIDGLQESVMIYDSILETGNEILDTVLTEKSLLCSRHRITLTCIADGSALAFMDAVDLYTLFGNAMDNAIEASMELPEEDRMIDLQVRQKAGLILITVTNRFLDLLQMEDGLPVTKKPEKADHGFGLKSIRAVAEKYDGLMKLNPREGLFQLRVTIPARQ